MEYSPFETPSSTESVHVELTHEDMIEGGTTTEPGIVQRVSSLARQALSQVRSTTHRVRAETERLVEGVRRRIPWSGSTRTSKNSSGFTTSCMLAPNPCRRFRISSAASRTWRSGSAMRAAKPRARSEAS